MAAVLVVPHRPAVLAAKMLATLDVLSGGRLVVGIGAGWLKTEFDAVVSTPFAERGAVTDEYIDAFRVLWTERAPRFAGRYTNFDGIVLEPKPVQRPHPPIWVGGESGPAVRRAARIGDALVSDRQQQPASARHPAAPAGRHRPPAQGHAPMPGAILASVGVGYRVKRYGAAVPPVASDGERRLFSGSEADIIADLRALRDMGVTALDIDFGRPTAAARDRGNAPLQGRGDRQDLRRDRAAHAAFARSNSSAPARNLGSTPVRNRHRAFEGIEAADQERMDAELVVFRAGRGRPARRCRPGTRCCPRRPVASAMGIHRRSSCVSPCGGEARAGARADWSSGVFVVAEAGRVARLAGSMRGYAARGPRLVPRSRRGSAGTTC